MQDHGSGPACPSGEVAPGEGCGQRGGDDGLGNGLGATQQDLALVDQGGEDITHRRMIRFSDGGLGRQTVVGEQGGGKQAASVVGEEAHRADLAGNGVGGATVADDPGV